MSILSSVFLAIVAVLLVALAIGGNIYKFRDAISMYYHSSRTDSEREAPPNEE